MQLTQAKALTRRVVFGDMLLNWFLGALLTFLPGIVDQILGSAPLLPRGVYRVIGILFLAFAAWQTWAHATERTTTTASLIFAALLALVPVVLLTIALLFVRLPLQTGYDCVALYGTAAANGLADRSMGGRCVHVIADSLVSYSSPTDNT
jgi:hypothetical protein